VNNTDPKIEIQYRRAVTEDGNTLARSQLEEVFESCDTNWRGFGTIQSSGLKLRRDYLMFDAEFTLPLTLKPYEDNNMCICGEILRGVRTPEDCPLFRNICSPENPVGACMVSNEGSCNTWYKYRIA
jgi:hydrogenase expression/formation protein HypD